MKKIGIITFHRALNYGALLQAYALKTKLEILGSDAQIIDYRNDFLEQMYAYPGFMGQKGAKNKLRYLLYHKAENAKRENFEAFRQTYLGLKNAKVYKKDNIINAAREFEVFITGSDQVWSPDAHNMDPVFFLDFVTDVTKKKSYAASFGVSEVNPELQELYNQYLKDYEICSVREEQGANIISQMMDKPTRVDVDPVFLLSKEAWAERLGLHRTKDRYAVIYSFGLSETQKEMANQCCKAGMKIFIIGESMRNPLDVPCRLLGNLGPREFAQLLFGASFVITNSFHGTALSIVFQVPFALEFLAGAAKKANSRLDNLVRKTHLESRVMSAGADLKQILDADIDWNEVGFEVDEMHRTSSKYLRGIVL